MSSLRYMQAILCLIIALLAVQAWMDPVPLPTHVLAASASDAAAPHHQHPHHQHEAHHQHGMHQQQEQQTKQPAARPRFTQQHEHHPFPPQALRQWQEDALAQMDAMHRLTAPLMHWFGGSSLDPYYRAGRWPSARARASPFSSLWGGWPSLRDPFASLSQLGRDWDSDFFARDERPTSALAGTDKTGGELQQSRGGGLDAMLTGSSFHVHEKDDAYELEAHVPGFRPEELHVEVQGDRLVLSGEKRSHEHRGGKTSDNEQQAAAAEPEVDVQQYSFFRKSYALPPELADSTGALDSSVANEAVKAAFDPEAHVLKVSVAKPHVLHARRVKPPPSKIEVPLQIQQPAAAGKEEVAADEPNAPPHQHTIPEPGTPPHSHNLPLKDELRR